MTMPTKELSVSLLKRILVGGLVIVDASIAGGATLLYGFPDTVVVLSV